MNIFEILQEAKKPTSNPFVIKPRTPKATDYTQEAEMDDEENNTEDKKPNTQELDNKEDNNESKKEESNEDDSENTESEEESNDKEDNNESDEEEPVEDDSDNTDDTATDYTQSMNNDSINMNSGDTDTDDSSDVSVPANATPEEKENIRKNALLIKNTIELYYNISSVIGRFDKLSGTNVEINKIIIQVKLNLTDLLNKLYDFIVTNFNNNTYTKNLYVYNYFIEGFKINIEILRKMNTLSNLT